jgi:hypothetical protein
MSKNYNLSQTRQFSGWKISFAITVMLLTITVGNAQVNVNPGAGSYITLKAAFDAINLGTHTGAITIDVVGNTSETASAVLNESGSGGASYTSIMISPSGGVARTISGNVAGHLIDLNGADNVIVDGLNTGGNSLVLENTGTGVNSTVRFIGDASNNIIRNTTLLGASSSVVSGTVFFSTGTTTGNDNNIITGCVLGGSGVNFASTAIYSSGTATAGIENSGNTVSSCNITDFFNSALINYGIFISIGSTDWTISNNKFYQTASRTFTTANTHSVIQIATGNNHVVNNNTIGFANAFGTGTYAMLGTVATRLIAINLAVGTTTASSVQGNTISAISLATASGASTTNGVICGINITAGNVNIGTTVSNNIGATTGINVITATSTTTGALVVGINTSSTGTIAIQNNLIGGLSSSGVTAAIAGSITGINVSGIATLATISNNTIGNATANNMRGGTSGLTTGSSLVTGINLPSTCTTAIVNNNTIQNLSSFGTGTTGYVRGIQTATSASATAINWTINNNVINNLTTNSTLTGVGSGLCSALGIHHLASQGCVISGNTISNISNVNTVATTNIVVVGISSANASVTTTLGVTVTKNRIWGLSNSTIGTTVLTPPIVAGIAIRSGNNITEVGNNMISLGNGQTTNTSFIGVWCNNGSTPNPTSMNIYHNSINIEGTATTGALPSFAFMRSQYISATANTVTIDARNNIFQNNRSGSTGQHFAISNGYNSTTVSAIGWAVTASNYNVLNANASTIGHWTAALNFTNWKTTSASDNSSLSAVTTNFVDTATGDLHLNMGVTPTQLESGGVLIGSVTTDYDNQARPGPAGSVNGGAFAPDFGADEFDGVYLDLTPPTILYAPLAFTCDGSVNRTLTTSIIDASGVPTTGAGLPVLYWKINAGTWNSVAGTYVSGSTYTFSFGAGAVLNDVITYYIVAQDNVGTPNVGAFPSAGASGFTVNPPAVATSPTTPSSYTINNALTGTYMVGVTGAYPTLTAAVAAYNVSCLSGPVTFSLIDATYPSETFPITINANPEASAVNTLTIQPATGVSSAIAGTSATGIIMMSGADYVTINGSNAATVNSVCPLVAATRNLTITNTSVATTSGGIWLGTTASLDAVTNCTVQNCIIIGNAPTTTIVGLGAGGATIGNGGTNNNNISFINNDIQACQFGIYAAGASAVNKNQNLIINQNTITSIGALAIGQAGIFSAFTNNVTISGNDIGNIINATSSQDPVAINVGFGAVNGFSTTATGIADGASNVTITNNKIGAITQSTTYSAMGIALGNTISGTSLIANNMISGVASNGTSGDYASGIALGGGTAQVNVYHNTVSMQGTIPGATAASQASACLSVTSATAATLDVKNNIFTNTQAGNPGSTNRFMTIGLTYSSTVGNYVGLVSNNNVLYSTGAGPGTYMIASTGGIPAGTARTTLADWQTETGRDGASLNTNPVFISATDLHMVDSDPANVLLSAGGTPTSVTTDLDCAGRSGATPSIGADENTFLGTHQFEVVTGFKAYPNPVSNILNIEYTGDLSNVSVYNLLGQQVLTKKVTATSTQIDMSGLNSGTYLVKVEASDVSKTIKVVKR